MAAVTSGFGVIDAPTTLGLFPGGVERLPRALRRAGLVEALGAADLGVVSAPAGRGTRDPTTGVKNSPQLLAYSRSLADATGRALDAGWKPVVLGGDCSVLLGTGLALKRRGRYGLLFIDGHADFYQPAAEPNGEAASMDLALVTGNGPAALADMEALGSSFQEADVVQFGRRDSEEAEQAGSQRIEDSAITVLDLDWLRRHGADDGARRALASLCRDDLDGFWVHLDCDVVDDDLVPAVDYRLPGGLSWDELEVVLAAAAGSDQMAGLEVTILNPDLDPTGRVTHEIVDLLGRALTRRVDP